MAIMVTARRVKSNRSTPIMFDILDASARATGEGKHLFRHLILHHFLYCAVLTYIISLRLLIPPVIFFFHSFQE